MKLCASRRKLCTTVQDNTSGSKAIVLCAAHYFHERSEFTSVLTSHFTSDNSVFHKIKFANNMKKTIITLLLLLAPCSLRLAVAQNLYIGSFYVTTEAEEKLYGDGGDKWANRRNVICDMFSAEMPDVLGLQSMSKEQFGYIASRIKTYYNYAGDILYNKTTLALDTCGTVEGLPEESTCSWARLRMGEKAFYVFNILFPEDLSVANTSVTALISAITEINTDGLTCFVLGNLGINETKAPYTRMNARYPDCYQKATTISAEFGTRNNFDLEANHGTERFDFIFASKNVTVRAYGQLQYGYYTQESDGSYKRRLLSTHFPVMAKVTLP